MLKPGPGLSVILCWSSILLPATASEIVLIASRDGLLAVSDKRITNMSTLKFKDNSRKLKYSRPFLIGAIGSGFTINSVALKAISGLAELYIRAKAVERKVLVQEYKFILTAHFKAQQG